MASRGCLKSFRAVGENLDMLTGSKLQKHQLLAPGLRFAVKYFTRAEGIGVPLDTALHIRHPKRHMAETNS